MTRMDPTNHNMPYWWAGLLAFFSTLSMNDYVFYIGAGISAFFTVKTYCASRREKRQQLEEEKASTALLKIYFDSVMAKPESERPASAEVMANVAKTARVMNDDA